MNSVILLLGTHIQPIGIVMRDCRVPAKSLGILVDDNDTDKQVEVSSHFDDRPTNCNTMSYDDHTDEDLVRALRGNDADLKKANDHFVSLLEEEMKISHDLRGGENSRPRHQLAAMTEKLVKVIAELKEAISKVDAVCAAGMAICTELAQRKAKELQLVDKAFKLKAKEAMDSDLADLIDLGSLTLTPLTPEVQKLKLGLQQLEVKKEMLEKIVADFKELVPQVESMVDAEMVICTELVQAKLNMSNAEQRQSELKAQLEATKAKERQLEAEIKQLKEANKLKTKELADPEKTDAKVVVEKVTMKVVKTEDDLILHVIDY